MDLVKVIQTQLESIYDVKVGESAQDYLIGKQELLELWPEGELHAVPKELFLVNPTPQEDTLEIALFLDSSLKDNLVRNNPLEKLDYGNISDFCTLIEGVSHFVYYLHKSFMQHNITQLEMELQAEIDKFILLSLFLLNRDGRYEDILDLLFENYFLHDELDAGQVERYETASSLARKYCHQLSQNLKTQNLTSLFEEIREFYLLSQEEKIRHILQ